MKKWIVSLLLLGTVSPLLAQLGNPPGLSLKVYIMRDSVEVPSSEGINPHRPGRLMIEANPNDPRKKILEADMRIEVIHARGMSMMSATSMTGLKEFKRSDVLTKLRPALRAGDRVVVTFMLPGQSEPLAHLLPVKE